jgi:hypothetical protein
MVSKNLQVPVTLVTDKYTLEWGNSSLGIDLVKKCFETIICVDKNDNFSNPRTYADTTASQRSLQFYNCNHWEAYDLSPYDETLFIDADYLIMSSALNNCWGSSQDIMINHNILSTNKSVDSYSKYTDHFGIRQYWATVIYFKKTEYASYMFELVKHVQENYTYYRQLYSFSNMYRNDNAFSIAVHMLNGFSETMCNLSELPISGLLMSWDSEDIHTINGYNEITIFTNKNYYTFMLAKFKNQDIHIMNKWAINRISDELISLYGGSQ